MNQSERQSASIRAEGVSPDQQHEARRRQIRERYAVRRAAETQE